VNDQELAQHYVQQGFDWIKEHGATYDIQLSRVDPATLSINSMDHCILAQAAGRSFEEILYTLYLDGVCEGTGGKGAWIRRHGFIGFTDEVSTEQHWLHLIAQDAAAE
jgi:hypothetical protein